MDEDDEPARPKRILKPPRWHQDYLVTQPKSSIDSVCIQGQTSDQASQEISQGAVIAKTQDEVRALAEDIQQIKGMLSELSHTMRIISTRSRSSSFSTSSEQSLNQTSPVRDNQKDGNTGASLVHELSECLIQHK